jgi:hypothetical protein
MSNSQSASDDLEWLNKFDENYRIPAKYTPYKIRLLSEAREMDAKTKASDKAVGEVRRRLREKDDLSRRNSLLSAGGGALAGGALANYLHNKFRKDEGSDLENTLTTAAGGLGGGALGYGLSKLLQKKSAIQELAEKAAGKRGLWDNIHAKRKRGEKPAKPGDKDYPDAKSWKKTTKEAGINPQLAEILAGAGLGSLAGATVIPVTKKLLLSPEELIEERKRSPLRRFLENAGIGAVGGGLRGAVRPMLDAKFASDNSALKSLVLEKIAKGRCWDGYEPVPGKDAYSDDSCRKVGTKKKKSEKKAKALQPGTEEFNAALHQHLYGKKKPQEEKKPQAAKKPNLQPGTEEFNAALYQHLYGKEKEAALKALVLEKIAKSPAWQREEGKSESGGLNAKGRASLKAKGQDIKAPVTQKNPKGEDKGRKASFCARMGGMKKKLTSEKTRNDPDSRINKSLRKWNC